MWKATGLTDDDLRKPLVAIAHTWTDVTPCSINQRHLAQKVREGVRAAGGTPFEFNTITVTDGIAMGTEGMKASLISREVVADSIELAVRGHMLDAVVCISGCDKTIPGTVLALIRLNLPGLMVYSGSIAAGSLNGKAITIQDVYEAIGACGAGRIDEARLKEIEDKACPGAGACGGQFTANTMAMATTMLGISPMGMNDIPATDPSKDDACRDAGRLVMELLKKDLRPSQVITRKSIENAITSIMASGGSTNGVLHMLAIAREAGMERRVLIHSFDHPTIARMREALPGVATGVTYGGGTFFDPLAPARAVDASGVHPFWSWASPELCRIAHDAGAVTLVDAISALGGEDFDAREQDARLGSNVRALATASLGEQWECGDRDIDCE
jgi:dihydroxy-acid dehydratase